MKIYNKSNKDFNFYDKSFGKNLKTHEDVLSGSDKSILLFLYRCSFCSSNALVYRDTGKFLNAAPTLNCLVSYHEKNKCIKG